MALEFIDLAEVDPADPEYPHNSHLSISGNYSGLRVGGVLVHGFKFEPRTVAAARKLIAWLQGWIGKQGGALMERADLSEFGRAYLDALLWTEVPSDGEDGCGRRRREFEDADPAPETITRAHVETEAFLYRYGCFIDYETGSPGREAAGHDFALTRNGHGAGFWGGGWPVYADMLTAGATSFGEVHLSVGDDGLIHTD